VCLFLGSDAGVGLLELGDGVFVLVEKDGAPLVVKCDPMKGLVGEAEDEEVGARREEEGLGEGDDLVGRHGLGGGVGGGDVMEEGFRDGGREKGEGGSGGWGGDGGDGCGDEGAGEEEGGEKEEEQQEGEAVGREECCDDIPPRFLLQPQWYLILSIAVIQSTMVASVLFIAVRSIAVPEPWL